VLAVNLVNASLIVIDVTGGMLLIVFVLLHAGRGGGLSDMFGGGQMGGSMAGSTVVERNLDRITVTTAVIFMFTTVVLALRLG
jgi:preprotein translocase subunit SecG